MVRLFVFTVIVGGLALVMNATRPTSADYLQELQRRSVAVASIEDGAFAQMRGSHPLDEMVAVQRPVQLMEQTQYDDYFVVSVFTTTYEAPRYGTRRVRTFGLFSKMLSSKLR